MFEQILQLVKEHMDANPEIAATIPAEHADAVHQEIAAHINDHLQNQAPAGGADAAASAGGAGGILSIIENSLSSGGLGTSAAAGGLVGALGSKFGLSSAVTGAIAAAIPGLLQKWVNKPNASNV